MSQLCLINATTPTGDRVDLKLSGGHIEAITPAGSCDAVGDLLDAEGRLVTPGFVDAHLHLDKVLTVSEATRWEHGSFQESIDMTLRVKRRYTQDDIRARAEEILKSSIINGTVALRAFADVGTAGGLLGVQTLIELRDEWRDLIDIQVVAFPQEGFLRDPGADTLVAKALEQGADVVGAFPWFELSNDLAKRHIQTAFDIAEANDVDLHAFVDDEPVAPHTRDLIQLAEETINRSWEGRVVVSHACGLASYDEHLADRTMRLVSDAGISVVSNAHISLVSKCQHHPEPKPRGITRVRQLMDYGVNVAAAQDDVADPYYPFGRGAMLEVASYLAHVAQLYRPSDVIRVLEAITSNAARAMRIADYGLEEGARADLVVSGAGSTPTEVIRLQEKPRWVLRSGRVVAENITTTELSR